MAVNTPSLSLGPGPGAFSGFMIAGPYEPGTVIESITLWGQDTADLMAFTGLTVRLVYTNIQANQAQSDIDGGLPILRRPLTVDSPRSFLQVPITLEHSNIIRNMRYILVKADVTIQTVNAMYNCGIGVTFRKPSRNLGVPLGV